MGPIEVTITNPFPWNSLISAGIAVVSLMVGGLFGYWIQSRSENRRERSELVERTIRYRERDLLPLRESMSSYLLQWMDFKEALRGGSPEDAVKTIANLRSSHRTLQEMLNKGADTELIELAVNAIMPISEAIGEITDQLNEIYERPDDSPKKIRAKIKDIAAEFKEVNEDLGARIAMSARFEYLLLARDLNDT